MTPNDRPHGATLFNPPLRIFATITSDDALAQAAGRSRFHRPTLQRHVSRDRVSRYFLNRSFTRRSRLD